MIKTYYDDDINTDYPIEYIKQQITAMMPVMNMKSPDAWMVNPITGISMFIYDVDDVDWDNAIRSIKDGNKTTA